MISVITPAHNEELFIEKCLDSVKVAASGGDLIVTIDADNRMTPDMLREVLRNLDSGRCIGGDVGIVPERISLGIVCILLVVAPFVLCSIVRSVSSLPRCASSGPRPG